MKKSIYTTPGLRRIGLLATIWWGMSGLVLLTWVWWSQIWYIRFDKLQENAFMKWRAALRTEYRTNYMIRYLWVVILFGWIIIAIMWLRSLKRNKISLKVALKDLFLTIR